MKKLDEILNGIAKFILYTIALLLLAYAGYWCRKEMVKEAVREVQQEGLNK